MKRNIFLIIFCLSLTMSFAQETPKPEFTNFPYYWNKNSNELIALSKETTNIKAGTKMSYQYAGIASKTKIEASNKISMLINLSDSSLLTALKIYNLKVKKKTREAPVVSVNFGKASNKIEHIVDFNSKKIKGNLYELVLSSELHKGEYVIINGKDSFTFSID